MISAKEIAKLVKLCQNKNKDTYVSYLELNKDGVKLNFSVSEKPEKETKQQARVSAKKATDVEEVGNMQLQFNAAKEIVETLHVEDPSAYEAMLLRGELGEEKVN